MNISTLNKNTKEHWENYFKNEWEKNDGRNQTRLFAHFFLNTISLPKEARSLLDVGCALGDALSEINTRYPHLKLFGCDFSSYAIENARKTYGNIATFENWSFEEIKGYYDIIYCSNTLEHFENYLDISQKLLTHCKRLYILVPYLEMRNGQKLNVDPNYQHVATFDKNSFDPLLEMRDAASIRSWIRFTPGAWYNGRVSIFQKLKASLLKRSLPVEMRQIFFEIIPNRR